MPQFVVIVGTQRSGTTVTRTILATHPKIRAYGEVFLPRHYKMRECYYHYLAERCAEKPEWCVPTAENADKLFAGYLYRLEHMSPEPVVVFDCKYQFLGGVFNLGVHHGGTPHMVTLMQKHGFKFLHLHRDNVLATHVSALVSAKTRVWATEDPRSVGDRTVWVDPNTIKAVLDNRRNEFSRYNKLLPQDAKNVGYEVLFRNPNKADPTVLAQIADHIGVEPHGFNLTPRYKKIGLPLKDSIQNFDEVAEALEGTPHEYMLYQDR